MNERVILLVDIGNSRVKWGVLENGKIHSGEAFATELYALESTLEQVWKDIIFPSSIWISNVAGRKVAEKFQRWNARHGAVELHFVKPVAFAYGVQNAYAFPERLGADRWVNLIAARHHAALPACIVDCGTALTVDVLDREGVHRGGMIAPGLELMRNALLVRAAGIDESGKQYEGLLADNTGAAIQSGTLQALVGLIERAVRILRQEMGAEFSLLLTGGDGEMLASQLSYPAEYVPDLVLKGLAVIAQSSNLPSNHDRTL